MFTAHCHFFSSQPIKFLSAQFLTNRRLALIFCAARSKWTIWMGFNGSESSATRASWGTCSWKRNVNARGEAKVLCAPNINCARTWPKGKGEIETIPWFSDPPTKWGLVPFIFRPIHNAEMFTLLIRLTLFTTNTALVPLTQTPRTKLVSNIDNNSLLDVTYISWAREGVLGYWSILELFKLWALQCPPMREWQTVVGCE